VEDPEFTELIQNYSMVTARRNRTTTWWPHAATELQNGDRTPQQNYSMVSASRNRTTAWWPHKRCHK
jgi:hypothetical protein